MKVFGWAADNTGCGWYRVRMPLDELARRGHETLTDTTMPDEWLDSCDVLIGQRVCKAGPSKTWQRVARPIDAVLCSCFVRQRSGSKWTPVLIPAG